MRHQRFLISCLGALVLVGTAPTVASAASAVVTGTVSGSTLSLTTSAAPSFSATGTQTLATNASSLTGVTSSCTSGTCTNPTNSVAYPVAVPAAATPPTPVKFFNAAANTGMGKFTDTPTIGVFVPQSSFAGSYTSTLTLAVVTGP
jgi:hypothetical protein